MAEGEGGLTFLSGRLDRHIETGKWNLIRLREAATLISVKGFKGKSNKEDSSTLFPTHRIACYWLVCLRSDVWYCQSGPSLDVFGHVINSPSLIISLSRPLSHTNTPG